MQTVCVLTGIEIEHAALECAILAGLTKVPSNASEVGTVKPCARYKAMNAMSDEAPIAAITGLWHRGSTAAEI